MRVRPLLALVLILTAAVTAGVAFTRPAAASGGFVTVSTTHSPDQPTPEENVTLTTRLESATVATEQYVVREVTVREGRSRDSEKLNGTDVDRRLRPDETVTAATNVSLDEPGEHRLFVHVRVQSSVESFTVVHPVTVTVYESHPRLSVQSEKTLPGSETQLNVSLANGQSSPIRGVELELVGDGVTVANEHRVRSSLASGVETTFQFTATNGTSGRKNLTARVHYTTANGTHRSFTRTLSTVFTPPENPGNVTLTGIQVSRDGETIRVSGTASNVGTTDAQSAMVRVAPGDGTRPAQSQSEYFVGSVAASDFTSFAVSATLTDNGSTATIPLRVSYLVDGVRQHRTVTVTYDPTADETHRDEKDGRFPLAIAGGAGVVLLVGAVAWRRYDGGA
ncbi:MAG: hypothetical protein ABEJ22_09415 [Haloferacaceae archaeon]